MLGRLTGERFLLLLSGLLGRWEQPRRACPGAPAPWAGQPADPSPTAWDGSGAVPAAWDHLGPHAQPRGLEVSGGAGKIITSVEILKLNLLQEGSLGSILAKE